MNDLISREEARDLMYHNQEPLTEYDLDSLPSIEAEPVRYGRWEQIDVQPYFRKHYYNSNVYCSVCHTRGNLKYNYCPNCGAKMDEVRE